MFTCIRLYFLIFFDVLNSWLDNFAFFILHLIIGVDHLIRFLCSRTNFLRRIYIYITRFLFRIQVLIAAPAFLSPLPPFLPAGVPRFRVFCLFMRAPSFRVVSHMVTSERKSKLSLLRKKAEIRTADPWCHILIV